ncbi:hypothetical protein PRZ48_010274 [Zasmidium cellare]|uniref:Proline iminopeptidase n=1 Tax=Zasmidium cellare TaxID=395010 RepID=A0ABR0E8S8_ZASCE|nr:hypothetical protein PRZ48_010274 [Zasmidium cellare]
MASYSHADPFDSGYLEIGSIHRIWYEQYGDPSGKPALFLHGGPGGNISKDNANFFDPKVYRILQFDQRGAGKSKPLGELKDNTTQHLIDDIEALRQHVNVKKWHMVFGGSWGSTLALAYAQAHPRAVGSLVLRGVLLATPEELQEIYESKAPVTFFPDAHEEWLQFLPENERNKPIDAYYRILTSNEMSETERLAAGKAWNKRELRMGQVKDESQALQKLDDHDWVIAHSRLEAHYFSNDLFMKPGQLLEEQNLAKIREIPTSIVQGRFDILCPPKAAWALHSALPKSELHLIPGAGHSTSEPGIKSRLLEPHIDAARQFVLTRLPANRNTQILLAGTTLSVAGVVLYPLAYYWSLGRQLILTHPNASSRSASLDCGEISSLDEDMISNPKYYRIVHDKVTKRIPTFTVTLSPKHERMFTALLRHNFELFSFRSLQGYLLYGVFPDQKHTWTKEYLQDCKFEEGDIICGVFEVAKRTPLRCELAMRSNKSFGPIAGLMVVSLRPRGEGAVLTNETIQWTKKDNGIYLPLEKWWTRWLHNYVSRYTATSAAKYLEELARTGDV